MEEQYVWVVTNPEDGWDCVMGVYECEELAIRAVMTKYSNREITDEDVEEFDLNEYSEVFSHRKLNK